VDQHAKSNDCFLAGGCLITKHVRIICFIKVQNKAHILKKCGSLLSFAKLMSKIRALWHAYVTLLAFKAGAQCALDHTLTYISWCHISKVPKP